MNDHQQASASDGDPVTVSAVICSCDFERRTLLRDAVDSLRRQDVPALEIIVVIDNSDRLLQWARETLADASVVENTCSKGLSGARNTGVQVSKGAIVAYLDDDATAPGNWVADLADAYRDPP